MVASPARTYCSCSTVLVSRGMPPPGCMVKRRSAKFGPSWEEISTWILVSLPAATSLASTSFACLTVILTSVGSLARRAASFHLQARSPILNDVAVLDSPNLGVVHEFLREHPGIGGGEKHLLRLTRVMQQVCTALQI